MIRTHDESKLDDFWLTFNVFSWPWLPEGDAPKDQKAAGAMVLPSPSGGQWYLGRTGVEKEQV